MMVSRPRQPKNDIDVYLKPLIDDLKLLCKIVVDVFDSFKKILFIYNVILHNK